MKRVGILYHPMIEAAHALAEKLYVFLSSGDVSAWLCSAWEGEEARTQVNGTDFILSVGGDGTVLRAAQLVVPNPTPIIGVNMGNLGFMTELSADDAVDKLPALLAGKGWIDERAMLEAELMPAEPGRGTPGVLYALNDVVMARGAIPRMVSIDASIDGEPLTTYRADGVIVATATGSTAYAFTVGGTILHPQASEFLLLPVLPHLSLGYTVVLPSTAVVRLGISTVHQAILSIDGYINLPVLSGDTVTVKHSSNTVRFLRTRPETSFYASLERRLRRKR